MKEFHNDQTNVEQGHQRVDTIVRIVISTIRLRLNHYELLLENLLMNFNRNSKSRRMSHL